MWVGGTGVWMAVRGVKILPCLRADAGAPPSEGGQMQCTSPRREARHRLPIHDGQLQWIEKIDRLGAAGPGQHAGIRPDCPWPEPSRGRDKGQIGGGAQILHAGERGDAPVLAIPVLEDGKAGKERGGATQQPEIRAGSGDDAIERRG